MKKAFIGFCIVMMLCVGCSNTYDDSNVRAELNQLSEEVTSLQEEYDKLMTSYLELQNLNESKDKYIESLEAFWEISNHQQFNLLERARNDCHRYYSLNGDYNYENGWYVILGEELSIEVKGFEAAEKVVYHYYALETDMDRTILSEDLNGSDGWLFTSDTIKRVFHNQEGMYQPSYAVYADVYLENRVVHCPTIMLYSRKQ